MSVTVVYRDADFLSEDGSCHGLSCPSCRGVFVNGQPISERFEGIDGDVFHVLLTCVPCGLKAATNG